MLHFAAFGIVWWMLWYYTRLFRFSFHRVPSYFLSVRILARFSLPFGIYIPLCTIPLSFFSSFIRAEKV